ncbi:hypothetical protein HT031_001994 [Scenedesmus sp. PABB004]|nr:hypothetical protein HT031_001994 [Scenedesmus sp. PABB004]
MWRNGLHELEPRGSGALVLPDRGNDSPDAWSHVLDSPTALAAAFNLNTSGWGPLSPGGPNDLLRSASLGSPTDFTRHLNAAGLFDVANGLAVSPRGPGAPGGGRADAALRQHLQLQQLRSSAAPDGQAMPAPQPRPPLAQVQPLVQQQQQQQPQAQQQQQQDQAQRTLQVPQVAVPGVSERARWPPVAISPGIHKLTGGVGGGLLQRAPSPQAQHAPPAPQRLQRPVAGATSAQEQAQAAAVPPAAAASCEPAKPYRSAATITTGALVWAKVARYPWWPAVVVADGPASAPAAAPPPPPPPPGIGAGGSGGGPALVRFLGTHDCAWVGERGLSRWGVQQAERAGKTKSAIFLAALGEADAFAASGELPAGFAAPLLLAEPAPAQPGAQKKKKASKQVGASPAEPQLHGQPDVWALLASVAPSAPEPAAAASAGASASTSAAEPDGEPATTGALVPPRPTAKAAGRSHKATPQRGGGGSRRGKRKAADQGGGGGGGRKRGRA